MLNTALSASGGIGTAGVYAILGYLTVFIGLVLLMAAITVMGKVMNQKKAETAPAPTPAPAPTRTETVERPTAPGSAGEVKLYDVPDREAAMLMAIVAEKMGKPINELRFKSIKEVQEK